MDKCLANVRINNYPGLGRPDLSENNRFPTGGKRRFFSVGKLGFRVSNIHEKITPISNTQNTGGKAEMATFGYGRVSTINQTTENQRRELEQAGYALDYWFEDAGVSGKVCASQRPQFVRLLDRIRAGETLVVAKLDRLGRDALDVLATVRNLQERGVSVIVHQLGRVDLTSPAGRLLLTMLSAVAEMERDLLIERTQAGLARAKAEGKQLGRPSKTTEADRRAILERLQAGESVSQVARDFNVSRATIISIRDADGAAEPAAPMPESEPHSYRRPDPDAPGDPRCQAKRRDGGRCKERTVAVVFVPDHRGQRAEFGACHRHRDDFIPHKSIFVLNNVKL